MIREGCRTTVRQLWPLLSVRDINRSLQFYRDQLGFALVGDDGTPDDPMSWCRLERGGSSIMLQQRVEQSDREASWGRGVCFYFICDDVDAMFAELSARGLQLEAPRLAYYGMKQLFVPEPDGYQICFESPTEHVLPNSS